MSHDLTARRTCAECGRTWTSQDQHLARRYCTDACAQRANRRVGKAKRRARIKAAPRIEAVSHRKVAERDGWRCHICRKTVTRRTWSIDHLIPLSYGGTHTYDNVALAHKDCNSVRSNTGSAQLLLVG